MATPSGARIEVHGAIELRRALKHMDADLKDLTKINKDVAGVVAQDAQNRVPVLTGRLRRTIRSGGNRRAGYVQAGTRRTVPYAGPIHFGWPARNIEAQPFLYDALDARQGEVVRRYEDRIADLVRRVGAETP